MNKLKRFGLAALATLACCLFVACSPPTSYDIILRGGTIYDGSGDRPYVGSVAILGDRIAAVGDIGDATAPENGSSVA